METADSDVPKCLINEDKIIGEHVEERILNEHKTDSLVLLLYVMLLIISVITIWSFKHRRFRYVHETGLAVIYGVIVGIAMRYSIKPSKLNVEYYDFPFNASCGQRLPPEKMIVKIPVHAKNGESNYTLAFQYSFEQRTQTDVPFSDRATFNPEFFFNVLLPPIIFTAGYSMKRRHFFRNIGAILTYAFIGTLLSALVIAGICYGFTRGISSLTNRLTFSDCVLFGSIVSATDPVTVLAIFNDLGVEVDLYALVFGESVLNDAVAIALYQSVEKYGSLSTANFDSGALLSSIGHFVAMFGCSFGIGVCVGCLTAILTKFTHIRDHPILETALFFLMSYSTFLIAEYVGYTGIVAVLFCGVTQAHYTYNNLSEESKLWTKQFFELLNFLAENFVFAYIGLSTFTFRQHYWDASFVFIALFACVVARAINIYPLSALINLCRGYHPRSCPSKRCCNTTSTRDVFTASALGSSGEANHASSSDAKLAGVLAIHSPSYDILPEAPGCAARAEAQPHRQRNYRITFNMQHMLVYSGLRGAMAYSLAIRNTSSTIRQMFFSTTIVIVMITVLLCGGFAMSMLNWLKIRINVSDHTNQQNSAEPASSTDPKEYGCFSKSWSHFDKNYMKPLLTHSAPPLTETLPWCCRGLARLLTTDLQHSERFSNNLATTFTGSLQLVPGSGQAIPSYNQTNVLEKTISSDLSQAAVLYLNEQSHINKNGFDDQDATHQPSTTVTTRNPQSHSTNNTPVLTSHFQPHHDLSGEA